MKRNDKYIDDTIGTPLELGIPVNVAIGVGNNGEVKSAGYVDIRKQPDISHLVPKKRNGIMQIIDFFMPSACYCLGLLMGAENIVQYQEPVLEEQTASYSTESTIPFGFEYVRVNKSGQDVLNYYPESGETPQGIAVLFNRRDINDVYEEISAKNVVTKDKKPIKNITEGVPVYIVAKQR